MKAFTHWLLVIFLSLNCYQVLSQSSQFLELRPGPSDGYDCEIRTDMDWPIWYEDDFIANAWTVQGFPFIERSLLKFDLSSLPEGAVIINAKLSLFCNTITGHHQIHSGNNASYLLRITQPWDQYSVTWNTQPTVTYDDAVEIPASTVQIQDYPNIDVTNQIKYFYDNPDQNYGFMFQLKEEEQYAAMVFSSSDHTDSTKRPLLSIEYTLCEQPIASFKHVNYNNAVQFTANSIGDGDYWWDFGNGLYSDLKNPIFVYSESGEYNVCLTVTDNCGTDTICNLVQICDYTVSGAFTSIVDGNFVNFTPELLSHKTELMWDFGDGFFSELESPKHYFNESGNYLVCMIAKDFCNQVISCDTISILPIESGYKSSEVIQLYPNPSTGMISVANGRIQANFESIKITNFNGTIVLDQNSSRLSKRENGYFCDFTGLESGIYTVHVVTDIGLFTQKAIIIAK